MQIRKTNHPINSGALRWLIMTILIVGLAGPVVPQKVSGNKVTIKGVRFSREVEVGEKRLAFRGGTLCRYRLFKVYTAALFTDPEVKSIRKILNGGTPKRLVLHYHRDIKGEDIREATERTLKKNPNVNLRQLRSRLEQIYSWYEDVGKGDRYWMDYVPGKGCELFLNGQSQGVVEGEDFAEAYFGIWLSDYSIKDKYRDRILGLN